MDEAQFALFLRTNGQNTLVSRDDYNRIDDTYRGLLNVFVRAVALVVLPKHGYDSVTARMIIDGAREMHRISPFKNFYAYHSESFEYRSQCESCSTAILKVLVDGLNGQRKSKRKRNILFLFGSDQ